MRARLCEYSSVAVSGYECVESDFQWWHYESCAAEELIQKHLLADAVAAKCGSGVCVSLFTVGSVLCQMCAKKGPKTPWTPNLGSLCVCVCEHKSVCVCV